MLWVELASGIPPVIYTAERCLKLVKPEHLIARYAFRGMKAGAMRQLKARPDKFQHSEIIKERLQEMPSIPPFAAVQRKRLRKLTLRKIQQSIVEKIGNERTETAV